MRRKTVVLGTLAVALAAGGYGLSQLHQALRVAAGVAAHHVCSMTFVGGQDPGRTYQELVVPMIGELAGGLLKAHVSRDAGSVEVSGPLTRLARADFTPGYGCRLALPGNQPLTPAAASALAPASDGFAPAGRIASDKPGVTAALDRVFAERTGEPVKRVKAVVIVKDGRVVAERYADGVNEHSPLISFSVAKSFTNALLGILVRQGRLRMDEPLDAPEWQDKGDPRRAITLEDLLRMRSGLAVEEAESAFSPVARMEFLHAAMAAQIKPVRDCREPIHEVRATAPRRCPAPVRISGWPAPDAPPAR